MDKVKGFSKSFNFKQIRMNRISKILTGILNTFIKIFKKKLASKQITIKKLIKFIKYTNFSITFHFCLTKILKL